MGSWVSGIKLWGTCIYEVALGTYNNGGILLLPTGGADHDDIGDFTT